ncbi:MAG TPA: DUF3015 family protein [Bdellovibrionota bacterium]|jgi:hypothetical protein
MKKQILLALALVAVGGTAQAAGKAKHQERTYERVSSSRGGHAMAGCGLGSLAIQDTSKWAQVGAAFLNGTGVQTFGITFGTSNCTEDGVASANREKDAFVEANLADIRRDLSVGKGEYLSSLASFYGCKGEQVDSFQKALRKHQDKLDTASPAGAGRVIDSVVAEEKGACIG